MRLTSANGKEAVAASVVAASVVAASVVAASVMAASVMAASVMAASVVAALSSRTDSMLAYYAWRHRVHCWSSLAGRLKLVVANVLSLPLEGMGSFDLVCANNFSHFGMKTAADMSRYLLGAYL